jgi:uncharacterized protein (TIGR00369 family)
MDQGPPQGSPALARRVAEAPSGFRQLLGYKVVEWHENAATVSLAIAPRHLNRSGVIHGGVIATLIDAAGGFAGCWCAIEGHTRKSRTVSMTVNYVNAVSTGRLLARARVSGSGHKIFHASVEVQDAEGKVVATGVGAYKYAPGSETPEGIAAPRKPEKRGTPLG